MGFINMLCLLVPLFLQGLLVAGCPSGTTGPGQLASWFLRDLDFDGLPPAPSLSPRSVAEEQTTVFLDGTVLTMENGRYSAKQALVVKGDSVAFVGGTAKAKVVAGRGAVEIHLDGKTIMPGFIEPHVHLIYTALVDHYLLGLSPPETTNPDGIDTLDAAERVIKDRLRNITDGQWVEAYGYDPSRIDVNLPLPRGHPDLNRTYLDTISNKTPIFILNQSGHLGYVNSAALAAAGVTDDNTRNNSGFDRDSNGHLNGRLFEKGIANISQKAPIPTPKEILGACEEIMQYWLSQGCTTVNDAAIGVVGAQDPALIQRLSMPLRFYGAISNLIASPDSSFIEKPPYMLGQATINAIKFWTDGSTQGFTAFLNSNYSADMPLWAQKNPMGIAQYDSPATLEDFMEPWLQKGFQLLVHANGDGATAQTLAAYEAIFKRNPDRNLSIHHRIEHFTVTEEEQLSKAKSLGLAVSNTIPHVNYWGTAFNDYVLGEARAQRIDPIRSEEDIGLLWSLNSDSPLVKVHPLLYVKTAATRQLYNSTDVLGPDQTVDVETAFKGVTVNPVAQIGVGDQIGSLERGKKADFVILDKDPRNVAPTDLDQLVVEETWVGGVRNFIRNEPTLEVQ